MLKALVKKQLMEIFRSYFFNFKKNQKRSKAGTVAMFILFAYLLVGIVGGMFVLLGVLLCRPFYEAGMTWFYFLMFCGISIFLGLFGTVFNTFSGLYKPHDNDLLLSCPIPVNLIIASRLFPVYLMDLMYTGLVMLPTLIVYWIVVPQTVSSVIGSFLFWLIISLFVFVLSCLFGWIVAQVSKKLKNKGVVTVLITVIGIGLYYVICFRAGELVDELLANLSTVGDTVKSGAYLLYLVGTIGEGNLPAMLISLLAVVVLAVLVWLIQLKSFSAIATATEKSGGRKRTARGVRARAPFRAVFVRELMRFKSSANYMLNCGLGILMVPAFGVFMLLAGGERFAGLDEMTGLPLSGVLAFAAMGMLAAMNDMAAPSVSLEGKNLWIIRSMPVPTRTVLCAKGAVQLLLSGVPMLFAAVCTALGLHMPIAEAVVSRSGVLCPIT